MLSTFHWLSIIFTGKAAVLIAVSEALAIWAQATSIPSHTPLASLAMRSSFPVSSLPSKLSLEMLTGPALPSCQRGLPDLRIRNALCRSS